MRLPDREFWWQCYYAFISERPPLRHGEVCCSMMQNQLDKTCDTCDQLCPDMVLIRDEAGEYGLPVHDGGSSYIEINHCPWCGRKLPHA